MSTDRSLTERRPRQSGSVNAKNGRKKGPSDAPDASSRLRYGSSPWDGANGGKVFNSRMGSTREGATKGWKTHESNDHHSSSVDTVKLDVHLQYVLQALKLSPPDQDTLGGEGVDLTAVLRKWRKGLDTTRSTSTRASDRVQTTSSNVDSKASVTGEAETVDPSWAVNSTNDVVHDGWLDARDQEGHATPKNDSKPFVDSSWGDAAHADTPTDTNTTQDPGVSATTRTEVPFVDPSWGADASGGGKDEAFVDPSWGTVETSATEFVHESWGDAPAPAQKHRQKSVKSKPTADPSRGRPRQTEPYVDPSWGTTATTDDFVHDSWGDASTQKGHHNKPDATRGGKKNDVDPSWGASDSANDFVHDSWGSASAPQEHHTESVPNSGTAREAKKNETFVDPSWGANDSANDSVHDSWGGTAHADQQNGLQLTLNPNVDASSPSGPEGKIESAPFIDPSWGAASDDANPYIDPSWGASAEAPETVVHSSWGDVPDPTPSQLKAGNCKTKTEKVLAPAAGALNPKAEVFSLDKSVGQDRQQDKAKFKPNGKFRGQAHKPASQRPFPSYGPPPPPMSSSGGQEFAPWTSSNPGHASGIHASQISPSFTDYDANAHGNGDGFQPGVPPPAHYPHPHPYPVPHTAGPPPGLPAHRGAFPYPNAEWQPFPPNHEYSLHPPPFHPGPPRGYYDMHYPDVGGADPHFAPAHHGNHPYLHHRHMSDGNRSGEVGGGVNHALPMNTGRDGATAYWYNQPYVYQEFFPSSH